jgi:hypothetical protein
MKTAISVAILLVVALVATIIGLPKPNPLGLGKNDKLFTRVKPDGAIESLIVVQQPNNWKPVDTLIVKRTPKPPEHVAGIEFSGELTIFGSGTIAAETDSFHAALPTEDDVRMTLIAGGARMPLKTERLKKIPPWVPGQPPALPGVAWRAYMYDADTLTCWGYDDEHAMYVGHLELHAAGMPPRPGVWHSFGPAREIPTPVSMR